MKRERKEAEGGEDKKGRKDERERGTKGKSRKTNFSELSPTNSFEIREK